jgi:hypothetical protein
MTGDAMYAGRESIQPRAFAVRHLIIQEVKFRKAQPLADAERRALDRVARGAEVEYDAASRRYVVRCEGVVVRFLPFSVLALYTRGDGEAIRQRRGDDPRHWDVALEENRREVAQLVGEMVALLSAGGAP